jgi:hypothetical protein
MEEWLKSPSGLVDVDRENGLWFAKPALATVQN